MSKIYIDSTIHNEWNGKFNLKLCEALELEGVECYLPQRDTNQKVNHEQRYLQNNQALKLSDTILAVANNESPNWGVEIGLAKGYGKWIVILASKEHAIPLMAEHLASKITKVDNIENIPSYIKVLANTVRTHN